MTRTTEAIVAENFERDVAEHEMTVLRDDGLYRHLRFRRPDRGEYWFDLVTWPGVLVINGDMGGHGFSRVKDMFAFFRSSHGINPSYWAEKVVTGSEGLKTYDEELFKQQAAEDLKEAEKDWPGVTEAWNEKVNGDWPEYWTATEPDARHALGDFEYLPEGTERSGAFAEAHTITLAGHGLSDGEPIVFTYTDAAKNLLSYRTYYVVSSTPTTFKVATRPRGDALVLGTAVGLAWRGVPFQFCDTGDWDLTSYDYQYLWCCHAIQWGIRQYDDRPAPALWRRVLARLFGIGGVS